MNRMRVVSSMKYVETLRQPTVQISRDVYLHLLEIVNAAHDYADAVELDEEMIAVAKLKGLLR